MRKEKISMLGKIVGSVLSVSALTGCPAEPEDIIPVDIISDSLPAENTDGVRPAVIYEEDINMPLEQRAVHDGFIDGVFEFRINPGFPGQPVGPVFQPVNGGEGELPPFDYTIHYNIGTSGNITGGELILTDNNNQSFRDGNEWTAYLTGTTFIHKGRNSETEEFRFSYNRGKSPANLTEIVEPPQPPYVPGDGFCDAVNGENHHNSPNDCPLPPIDGCKNNIVGDGVCNLDCEDPMSEDCFPSTKELIDGGAAKAYFIDSNGNRAYSITTNPSTVRINLTSQLEKRLKSSPAVFAHEENGPSECISVSGYTQPIKTGSGIYDSTVAFLVTPDCLQDEVIAMLYSLEDKEGNIYKPVIGSAFLNHDALGPTD